MQALNRCLAAACLGAALSAAQADPGVAANAPVSCQPLSHLQSRLLEKADQGIGALRGYVYITRAIYQVDMMEVADSIDAWYAARRCAEQLAHRKLAPEPLAQAPAAD